AWGLLSSMPRVDREVRDRLVPIKGNQPSLINLPSGCSFHPRCPYVERNGIPCKTVEPTLAEGTAEHGVACHIPPAERLAIFKSDIAPSL
ncbi:ABC transporter ATP-binding protein, partial [Dactylosporangium aurantiacum]|uniref:oligopeptide/dipeptide ABC transporter ATP-binding protein n=1 Tax=Dactylosporangium aurantiacum TaxID=35754 RepID=UPI002A551B48|nr:ABC transporter ATP-binding protein [Dactylosporangium aurantiacum]